MNMMAGGQGMMPGHPSIYQQQTNGANGNDGGNQMLRMGYMHEAGGQYMMGHG